MSLSNLISEAYLRCLEAHKYYRILKSDLFKIAYEKAKPEKIPSDARSLKKWIRVVLKENLELLPVTELRKMGRKYRVFRYNTLQKDELIDAIRRKTSDIKTNNG